MEISSRQCSFFRITKVLKNNNSKTAVYNSALVTITGSAENAWMRSAGWRRQILARPTWFADSGAPDGPYLKTGIDQTKKTLATIGHTEESLSRPLARLKRS